MSVRDQNPPEAVVGDALCDIQDEIEQMRTVALRNARIYEALRGIYARGEPVDLITAVEPAGEQHDVLLLA